MSSRAGSTAGKPKTRTQEVDDTAASTLAEKGGPLRSLQGTDLGQRLTSTRLTPVQRRIARHILQSPREVAFNSSVELADAIGVSQPSVTRFANAVGFGGYPEFLRTLRQTLFDGSARSDDGSAESRGKWDLAIERSIEDLQHLRESLRDRETVESASRELMASVPLVVYGCRLSLGLAEVFALLAGKIHPFVWRLDSRGSQAYDQISQAALAGAKCMLAIVLPRYPSEAERTILVAKRAGLRVLLVTDSPLASIARNVDQILAAPVNTDLVFDTLVAPMQLLSILLEGMVDADPEHAEHRLDLFDQVAAEEGIFLADQ
jgi:DNA-binding MurR/RpiR family transcriptional regulator